MHGGDLVNERCECSLFLSSSVFPV